MQILDAPYQSPVNVSTDLSLSFYGYQSNLLAFGAANAPGPESVYLRAPYGLLNVETGVELPRDYLTAVTVRSGSHCEQTLPTRKYCLGSCAMCAPAWLQ